MALGEVDTRWQDRYIDELVAMLDAIRAVVDDHPEVWESLERAGISLRTPVR